MQSDQAASELTEDQMVNFLGNTLGEEIDIELGENAEIDSEDIWDVLVGATVDEDSVAHRCEISEESPHGNTNLHHLRTTWTFKEFLEMVRHAAGTALAVRRAVPANKPPDDRFTR